LNRQLQIVINDLKLEILGLNREIDRLRNQKEIQWNEKREEEIIHQAIKDMSKLCALNQSSQIKR